MLYIFLFLICVLLFIIWSCLKVASLCEEEDKPFVKDR